MPRRRRSFASVVVRSLLIVFVLLALGGVVALAAFDPNVLKPRIEAAVTRATGRAFVIRGPLRLQWHGGLIVEATDIGLANPPGGSRPDMIRVPAATAQVALLPLLGGEARIDSLLLIAPDVLLEHENWRFERPVADPSASPGAGGGPAWFTFRPSMRIVAVTTQDGKLTWRDGARTATYPFGIEGSATPLGPDRRYDLQATVTGSSLAPLPYGDTLRDPALRLRVRTAQPTLAELTATVGVERVKARATLPPLDALAGGRPRTLPLDLSLESSAGTATIKGQLAGVAVTADVAVRVAQGGAVGLGDGAVSLDAHVVTGPEAVEVTNLAFAAKLGDLAGTLSLTADPRPKFTAQLTARHLDVGLLRAALLAYDRGAPPPPVPAAPAAGAAAPAADPHLLPDTRLPFGLLLMGDADVTLALAELVDGSVTYRDVAGHLVVANGQLALDPVSGAWPGGKLSGSAHVDASVDPPTVAAVLHAPVVALPSLLAVAGLPDIASGSAALDLDLKGSGDNARALAASVDGTATLSSVDGAFDNQLLADILAAAHLPPLGGRGRTDLRCLAVRMAADHGRVAIEPLVVDTGRVLLQGAGTVDLAAETIAMQLRPMLRAGPGIVVPIHVTGPLRTPKLGVDATSALTGLLTDRGGDPCAAALATIRGAPVALPPLPAQNAKPPKPADLLRSLFK